MTASNSIVFRSVLLGALVLSARLTLATGPLSDSCQRTIGRFFERQTGHFYIAMRDWEADEWYQKGLAKAYQARLVGVPRHSESVALDEVKYLHPIDPNFGKGRTWGQTIARSQLILDFLRSHPNFSEISEDFQKNSELSKSLSAAAESLGGLSTGYRMPDGKVILIDGNGRLAAWQLALSERAKEVGSKNVPHLSLAIQVIDWKDAPPGTSALIADARKARGGEGWDPIRPNAISIHKPSEIEVEPGLKAPFALKSAVNAYYHALSELFEAQEKGKYRRAAAWDVWKEVSDIPTTGTDTRRVSEGIYQLPPDMMTFSLKPDGTVSRKTRAGTQTLGEAAKLSAEELIPGKHYLFILDAEGNLRIAAEDGLGEPRGRKHGDLSPASFRSDTMVAIEKEARRLREETPEGLASLSADEAFQDAITTVLYHSPPDLEKYNQLLTAAQNELRASLRAKGVQLPEAAIRRKARTRALRQLELLKERLEDVIEAKEAGPMRGLAKLGGDFKVLEAASGEGRKVLRVGLSSSYTFARLDGVYYDTDAHRLRVAEALKLIAGKGIEVECVGCPSLATAEDAK